MDTEIFDDDPEWWDKSISSPERQIRNKKMVSWDERVEKLRKLTYQRDKIYSLPLSDAEKVDNAISIIEKTIENTSLASSVNTSDRGYVYVALNPGCQYHLKKSVRSVRLHDKNAHVTVFTDIPNRIDARYFDNIIPIPHAIDDANLHHLSGYPDQGIIAKVKYLYQAPYKNAIFLDYDTYIDDDITDIFDLMNGGNFDLAIAHSLGHHSISGFYPGTPYSMSKFNLGVIGYRRNERVDRFMEKWWSIFSAITSDGFSVADEPAFTRALYESHDIRYVTLPHEYNFRFIFLSVGRGKVKIFHGRDDDIKAVAEHVNSENSFRVFGGGKLRCKYEPEKGFSTFDE